MCNDLLTGDILGACDNESHAGLEVNVLFFNTKEIDKSVTTFNATNPLLVTNFAMKTGKVGFLVKGVKQSNELLYSLVKKETSSNKFKHTLKSVILNFSAANKLRLFELSKGGEISVMVETKWQNTGSVDAFQLAGYDFGMTIDKADWSSKEKESNIVFELTSPEGYEEPKMPLTVLINNYADTKAFFDAKFQN